MISINMSLVYTIINLVVLYLLLRHFLIKPVTQIMEKRRKLIEDGLKNAENTQNEALQLKQEYENALSGAKEESIQIIEKARTTAKAEYDRIVGEAGNQAGSIIESAKETVRIEREKTMQEMQAEIAGLAVASAAKLIGRNTDDQENQDLYDQFLKEAGESHEDADND
ncbi:F0F1 ATP synthase subunit B [Ruminococcus sp. CLA-AA-H200]|uniref:ATP synthase subunit b n=1 Tax=Ruminococcus turbiniformis TaxID=2881258 RepID=A0ABS8FSR4_9FIRM|nr:F0F1 ATP synthase subunit B [Ruminococcus turbiniformis]MCC2253021.1 F0F1 ATP synthase subunit B [Ruminococcus turbiniformis]